MKQICHFNFLVFNFSNEAARNAHGKCELWEWKKRY